MITSAALRQSAWRSVANAIRLASLHGVLVTGSNRSRKSTFLRRLGANLVLAHTISTRLAEGLVKEEPERQRGFDSDVGVL